MKTVLITGASRGIGAACAAAFAEQGYRVGINYYQSEMAARELRERIVQAGGIAESYRADVSDPHQVQRMVAEMTRDFGSLDVLVNNAGIGGFRLFTEIAAEEWERMFSVNVTGMFHCAKAVLPAMIRRREGKIINISSIWGITGASCEVHYSATKAAVIGLTKALAKELGPSNIQVNCVAPGVVDTEMNAALSPGEMQALLAEIPLGRIALPSEIAETVLFLASEASNYLTGQVISPNGGFVI